METIKIDGLTRNQKIDQKSIVTVTLTICKFWRSYEPERRACNIKGITPKAPKEDPVLW